MHARPLQFATALLTLLSSMLAVSGLATVYRIDNPDPAPQAGFGTAVAGLADQNGDGVTDFAVGVPGSDRVDVFSGANRIRIRSLHDPEGRSGMRFGYAIAGIGDIDGDGVEDIAVGAPGPAGLLPLPCDPTQPSCPAPPEWGRVFLFSGATGAMLRKIVPASEFFAFGFSLAALGDVNGDGVPDLAVGAPEFLNNRWGEVYAFSGKTGGELWVFREPPYPNKQAIASLATFMAPTGDLNGDGRHDLLVAAPFHDITGAGTLLAGKVFVLSGSNGGVIRSHQAAVPLDNGLFGGTVSGAGDQNGDAVEDYLIGHRGSNEVLLFSGGSGALLQSIPSPADAGDGLLAFARAGDRDGDGKEDFWVGIPAANRADLLNRQGTALLTVTDPGSATADALTAFASRLARIADINGDGKADLLVGKPGEDAGGQAAAGAVFLVTSNRPPIADAGADRTAAANASCQAQITLDGSGSSDPDGDALTYAWSGAFGTASGSAPTVTLPLGKNTITLVVTDGNGGSDTSSVDVTVVDMTPPAITSVTASPATLWPPDHTMRAVSLSVIATDNCDAAVACGATTASSSEPENGLGDGDTAPDVQLVGSFAAMLRAERSGRGDGRLYTIAMACRDASGNSALGSTTVTVPISRGN
jgi:hypothetical protein